MNRTSIEWVKNPDGSQGYTWNPITGCLNGCSYCYARKLANGRLKERYLKNTHTAPGGYDIVGMDYNYNNPFYPRLWRKRFDDIRKVPLPWFHRDKDLRKGIFVCDMSDLFGIGIPDDWTRSILENIKVCSQHRFYLLTKQPQNLARWSPFPDNCYVGTTITSAEYTHGKGIGSAMEQVTASMIYLSIEPILGRVTGPVPWYVKWVIIGGLTCGGADLSSLSSLNRELTPKPYGNRYVLLPKREWVEEIVAAADKAGVKVFLKDNLKPLFPERLRQEIPK